MVDSSRFTSTALSTFFRTSTLQKKFLKNFRFSIADLQTGVIIYLSRILVLGDWATPGTYNGGTPGRYVTGRHVPALFVFIDRCEALPAILRHLGRSITTNLQTISATEREKKTLAAASLLDMTIERYAVWRRSTLLIVIGPTLLSGAFTSVANLLAHENGF